MSAIIKYRQISKSPLPWDKTKTLAIVGSFAYETTTGILPYMVIKEIRKPLNGLIEDGLSDLFAGGMDVAQDSLLDNVGDALGDSSIIFLAISLRTAFSLVKDSREFGFRSSLSSAAERLKIAAFEQSSFVLIDILIDNFTDFGDSYVNAIVISLRIVYGLGKIAMNSGHNKKKIKQRLVLLEEAAYSSLIL